MTNTEKLLRAKEAMLFLRRAIETMEGQTGPADPDYDLWHAWQDLNKIQAALVSD